MSTVIDSQNTDTCLSLLDESQPIELDRKINSMVNICRRVKKKTSLTTLDAHFRLCSCKFLSEEKEHDDLIRSAVFIQLILNLSQEISTSSFDIDTLLEKTKW